MGPDRYQRIKAILADVLDAGDGDRARVLADACGDDVDLRAEVESLLRHDTADNFLEPVLAPLVTPAPRAVAPADETADPRVGRTVGNYRVVRRLGEGGMGIVYEGQDTRLRRTVALKFLRPSLLIDPTIVTRFLHEARAGAVLDHPNICAVHGIEETESGELFIILAYCEGESLKHRLARGPLGCRESLRIAGAIATALGAAHAVGVVHRDVKPGNIMLTTSGVKLLDFGIAKVFDHTSITVRGAAIGTAAYSSPEQAEGGSVDHRTDIFSLGVVLHEMLTGGRPFDATAANRLAAATAEAPALRALVLRALAPDRDRRFVSMDEMHAALRAVDHDLANPAIGGAAAQRLAAAIDHLASGRPIPADTIVEAAAGVAADPHAAPSARAAAIRYLYFLGQFEMSARLAAALLDAGTVQASVGFDLAASLAKARARQQAIDACERALGYEDGRPILLIALGAAAAGHGRADRLARVRRCLEAEPHGDAARSAIGDLGFGGTTRPLEYFGPARVSPDLAGYLALRRVPGSLAALVERIGLVAYLGFDADLDELTAAPQARALVRAIERDDA